MDEQKYNEILRLQKTSNGQSFWPGVAEKYGGTPESNRSEFRREKKKRKELVVLEQIGAKILLYDVEISPTICYTWGVYDQHISPDSVMKDWYVLSWAAKWLCDSKTYSDVLTSEEAKAGDDKRIVSSMWEMLNEADIVIAHNGNKFDARKLNTRFILWGLQPPSRYQQIDTLQVAKSVFSFTSNKLDYINGFLGIGQKTETGLDLWKRCYSGDNNSLAKMVEYNRNDVGILEELYFKFRPWMKHPNLGLYFDTDEEVCPNCGGELESNGYYYTPANKYEAFRCKNCGANSRGKYSLIERDIRKNLAVN